MSVAQMAPARLKAEEKVSAKVKLGAASAAFIASGIGCFLIGLFTTLAEMSPSLKTALTWSTAVGPLSGKTGVGIIVWIISWVILHNMWKDKETNFGKALTVTLVLLALGFLLTFPPLFQFLAGE